MAMRHPYDRDHRGFTDRMRDTFRGRDPREARSDYGHEYRGGAMRDNSWTDRGWTADSADHLSRRIGNRYDRDVRPTQAGWNAGGTQRGRWNLGSDADYGHRWGTGGNWGYDRDMRAGGITPGYGRASAYDRDFDRGYKSRAETDMGDPFGDRAQHTPIRVVDEDRWDRNVDRDRGWGARDRGYDVGYRSNGINNDPYYGGGMNRYDNGYRGHGRDRDWF